MKVTFGGILVALVIVLPSEVFFFTCEVPFLALFLLVKYGLGERFAAPLYSVLDRFMNWVEAQWFTLVALMLENVQGTRVAYTIADGGGQAHLEGSSACKPGADGRKRPNLRQILSPPSSPGKAKIVMLNHHCRVDWIYLFLYCARSNISGSLRIVLKEGLKALPTFGWTMQLFRFLFLSRSWANDEAYLKAMTTYYKRSHEGVTILIFPEGTDLSASNIEKSQAYAKKTGLPVFRHVLNPRTTGLVALKDMLGPDSVEEIIDCTIGYTYGVPDVRPREPSLIDGTHPKKIHLLLRRYHVDSCDSNPGALTDTAPGSNNEALTAWIHARFAEKEQLLSRFWTNNPVGFDEHDVRAVYGADCGVASYDEDVDREKSGGKKGKFACYVEETGIVGGLLMPAAAWVVEPTFALSRLHWLPLIVYAVVVAVAVQRYLKKAEDLQHLFFLKAVKEEDTLLARLTGKREAIKKAS